MQYRPKKIDYTSPASAQGGPGIQKSVTWYVGTPYVNMTASTFAETFPGATPGDLWWLGDGAQAAGGNAFMFVKATVGLTLGQLVAAALPTTGTVTNNASQSTTASILTNINNAATVSTNGDVNNWVFVQATGASLPQLRRIKQNTSSTTARYYVALPDTMRPNSPTDADVFDTLATDTNPCCIIRPYNVIVNTATTVPLGVSLGTVTAGNYTIVQVAGLAVLSVFGGGAGGTAVVVNQPVVGGAAGKVTGSAAAAANLYLGAGLMLPTIANTADVASPLLQPVYVNFTGQ